MKKKVKNIIFLHLPKNAGTTIKSILKKNYSSEETLNIEHNEASIADFEEFIKYPQEKRNSFHLIQGHFDFGIHNYFSNQYKYITMLRHPIQRTISFYTFVKNNSETRLYEIVKNKSLYRCVTEVQDFDVVNGQARKISGTNDETKMLKQAIENIENHFIFVGLQEYFEESMVLLQNKLKIEIPLLNRLNKSIEIPKIVNELIYEIEKQNQIDLKLYEIIKTRFLQEIKKIYFFNWKKKKLLSHIKNQK